MKSKLLTYLMIILEIFIIGALIVLFKLNIKIEYWYSYFLLYVVAFLVSIYLNVIFHELGHLMMGF